MTRTGIDRIFSRQGGLRTAAAFWTAAAICLIAPRAGAWNYLGPSAGGNDVGDLEGIRAMSRFTAGSSFTATKMKIYIDGAGSGTGKLKMAIYSHDNERRTPGDLLGETQEITVSAAGWLTANLNSPVSIASGRVYWLGFITNNGGVYIGAAEANGNWITPVNYANPWENPWDDWDNSQNWLWSAMICATDSGGAATAKTWTGSSSANWNTAANWSPAAVLVNQDTIIFHASGAGNLSTANNISELIVSKIRVNGTGTGAVSIGGNSFSLGIGGIDMSTASKDLTISAGMTVLLTSATTFAVAGGRTLAWTGWGELDNDDEPLIITGDGATVISGGLSSIGGILKSGNGVLTLSGNNTFRGGVTLSAGTLNLNSATAPGTGTLTINGGTINNTSGGAITLANNNAQTWGGKRHIYGIERSEPRQRRGDAEREPDRDGKRRRFDRGGGGFGILWIH